MSEGTRWEGMASQPTAVDVPVMCGFITKHQHQATLLAANLAQSYGLVQVKHPDGAIVTVCQEVEA